MVKHTTTQGLLHRKRRLGDLLMEEGIINNKQLEKALERQKKEQKKLGTILVDMGFTTESEIANALVKQLGLERIELASIRIKEEVLNLITEPSILKKYVMLPFAFAEGSVTKLLVAMENPLDMIAIDDLSIVTNTQIIPVIATNQEIMAAIDRYYGNAEVQAVAKQFTKEKERLYKELENELNTSVNNAPIVILVRTIIEQAVRQRASDIHIEPLEGHIRVRYRVDGALQEVGEYPDTMLSAIIARIKIIGGMDISEKRKPQDGRITQDVDKVEYDIRVSILPTVYGEKIVMRLTAKNALTRDKSHLGFTKDELHKFNKLLENPHGMLLVTGPTGSGKSTTLYTALSELNKEDVNIITVEDPVEANINGINQVQVNTKADLTFASALRSILRQDPDIIMIGEIRDQETASIAVTASITGHLVVSTLHTNSAASSITRLVDMGIEPYLLADATIGVIAQRLVRRLCKCKRLRNLSSTDYQLLEQKEGEKFSVFESCGCPSCNETGYLGRIGVYEIMPISSRIKAMISKNCTAKELQEEAQKEGMCTLKQSVKHLVLEGVTSLEEMRRIAYSNDVDS